MIWKKDKKMLMEKLDELGKKIEKMQAYVFVPEEELKKLTNLTEKNLTLQKGIYEKFFN